MGTHLSVKDGVLGTDIRLPSFSSAKTPDL